MSESLPASAHENSQTTVTPGRSRTLWLRAAIVLLAGGALIFWQRHRIISPALRAVATHHVRNHDLKAAAAWAETARRIVPDDPSLAILQAQIARRAGDSAAAAAALQSAEDLGAAKKEVWREQVLAMAQAGQLRQTEPHLAELLTDATHDNREVCEAFVIGYIRTDRTGSALKLLDSWIADAPGDAAPLVFRAGVRQMTGQPDEAETDFRAAMKLQPGRSDVRLGLAQLLVTRKRFDEAEQLLAELQADGAFPVLTRIGLAQCLQARGASGEAVPLLSEACELDPQSLAAARMLGLVLLESGRPAEAVEALQQALQLRPGDPETHTTIAQAYSMIGDQVSAEQHLQVVAASKDAVAELDRLNKQLLSGGTPEQLIRAGELQLNYGDPQEGMARILAGLDADPDNIKALNLLIDYYERRAATDKTARDAADGFRRRLATHERPDTPATAPRD